MKKVLFLAALGLSSLAALADNECLVLNSSSRSYVEIPHFATPAEMTIEAWIKTSQSNTGTIVAWKDVNGDGESSMFRVYNGLLQYGEWYGNTWSEINSPSRVATGSWVHVAVTRKGSAAALYVNGEKVSEGTMHSSALCSTDNLKIGALGTVWNECFNGEIDEVRIWSKQRTAEEIRSNFRQELTGAPTGLEGYWNFNGNAKDRSAKQRNGSENSVTYATSDIFNTEKGKIKSLAFEESASALPALKTNISRSGQIYWAFVEAGTAAPTAEQLKAGTSANFKAHGTYTAVMAGEQTVPFKETLEVGKSYVPYAVLQTSDGQYSDVVPGTAFTYQGLSCLPQGWTFEAIGHAGSADKAVYADGTFTLDGSGSDIWYTSDGFLYAYRPVSDDFDCIVKVKQIKAEDTWTKVGLMLRASTEASAPHVFVCQTVGEGANRFVRSQSGGTTSVATVQGYHPWLRLMKKDNWIVTYISDDGKTWQKIDSNIEWKGNKLPYIGLAVCGHGSGTATAEFTDFSLSAVPDSVSLSDRGVYFYKKKYVYEAIPQYASISGKLPRPVLGDNPDWVRMYNKAWQLAFSHIKRPSSGSPLVSNFYDENFDGHIFQWDMLFMTLFGRYAEHVFPGIRSLDNFYCRQHESGCITRCLTEDTGEDNGDENSDNIINPPLFSWAELLDYRFTADTTRLSQVLPVLEKYAEFVELKRRGDDTPHKLYWNNGQASGMDNLPRDTGRENLHHASDHQGWADMSAQMVVQYQAMAEICDILAKAEKNDARRRAYEEKNRRYTACADTIGRRMNQWLWNEADGLYYDVDTLGRQTNWKTIACFWPLLAGITNAEQDSALVRNLHDPNTFWRDNVFPALSADDANYSPRGGYWCGGVWAPSNYAVIKGLERKHIDAFAHLASMRYVSAVYDVFKQTGTFWENYAPEKKSGRFNHGTDESDYNACRRDFVGWTGLAPISVLIENVLGFRVDGPENRVDFDLRRLDRHGIERLHFVNTTTSIIADKREDSDAAVSLTLTTDRPYTLVVHRDNVIDTLQVAVGTNQVTLPALTTSIASGLVQSEQPVLAYDKAGKTLSIRHDGQPGWAAVYSLDGSRVYKYALGREKETAIRVPALPQGVYIVDMTVQNRHYSRKIRID